MITAAAVVELIHLATLYHDDVMDEATMRRGAKSANARWDNTVAILTGDFLFAHASRLVADLGPDAVRIIAETFAELVTGQMRETRGPRPDDDPVQHYLTVIAEKTGSLIATAGPLRRHVLRLPAGAGGGAAPVRRGDRHGVPDLRRHHRHRLAADSSGKTPGTDLREGVHTLPMLYTLAERGPRGGPAAGAARRPDHRRRRGGRGAGAAAGRPGPGPGPGRAGRPGRRRPAPSWRCCPTGPARTRWPR